MALLHLRSRRRLWTVLRRKQEGRYLVLAIDPDFEPGRAESRTPEFGLTMTQDADTCDVPHPRAAKVVSQSGTLTDGNRDDLLLAMIVAKNTQSNAVVIAMDGHTIGIGAGQQSRISATRLACAKADMYRLLAHPKVFDLSFAPEIGRIEKINVVDMFLRFEELSATERQTLTDRLPCGFQPLTAVEREIWPEKARRFVWRRMPSFRFGTISTVRLAAMSRTSCRSEAHFGTLMSLPLRTSTGSSCSTAESAIFFIKQGSAMAHRAGGKRVV